MRVEHGEVADDDRNRKSDSEDSREGAQSADEHSGEGSRRHVAVAYGGHGDQGPPQTMWYAVEIVIGIFLKNHAGKPPRFLVVNIKLDLSISFVSRDLVSRDQTFIN